MTLLARLQAATGPDRELDVAIARAAGLSVRPDGWMETPNPIEPEYPGLMPSPFYTASIDCALSWMPEGAYLSSVHYDMHPRMDGRQWFAAINFGGHYRGEGRTMQGAINVAIAKARGIE